MADDQRPDDEVEDALPEAPERGSADELMDHGAADDELGPMRHSAAHVLAEADGRVLLVPESGHPREQLCRIECSTCEATTRA